MGTYRPSIDMACASVEVRSHPRSYTSYGGKSLLLLPCYSNHWGSRNRRTWADEEDELTIKDNYKQTRRRKLGEKQAEASWKKTSQPESDAVKVTDRSIGWLSDLQYLPREFLVIVSWVFFFFWSVCGESLWVLRHGFHVGKFDLLAPEMPESARPEKIYWYGRG
jgi:hypothetical protein